MYDYDLSLMDHLNPWDRLTLCKYLNNNDQKPSWGSINQRIHSAIFGTLFDLAMVPTHMGLALLKTPIAAIRAVIIYIDPSKGDDFLKDYKFYKVAIHIYRAIGSLMISIFNPFLSLWNVEHALDMHLQARLISNKFERSLHNQKFKKQKDDEEKLQKDLETKKNIVTANVLDFKHKLKSLDTPYGCNLKKLNELLIQSIKIRKNYFNFSKKNPELKSFIELNIKEIESEYKNLRKKLLLYKKKRVNEAMKVYSVFEKRINELKYEINIGSIIPSVEKLYVSCNEAYEMLNKLKNLKKWCIFSKSDFSKTEENLKNFLKITCANYKKFALRSFTELSFFSFKNKDLTKKENFIKQINLFNQQRVVIFNILRDINAYNSIDDIKYEIEIAKITNQMMDHFRKIDCNDVFEFEITEEIISILKKLNLNNKDISKIINNQDVRNKYKKIRILRQEKETFKEKLENSSDHRLKRKIAKAEFALQIRGLGFDVGLKISEKGVNKALFITDVISKKKPGKIIGVFKPENASTTMINFIKEMTGQTQEQLLNKDAYPMTCAEKATYIVANEWNNPYLTLAPVKIMEMEIIADPKQTELKETKMGAFIVYEGGTKEAQEIIPEWDKKEDFSEEELNLFQSFTALDYFTGNLDRHEQNWLVKWNEVLKLVVQIFPIDNSNSFPERLPGWQNIVAWKSRFAWKNLKIAKKPYTAAMKQFIESKSNDLSVDLIIKKITSDPEIDRASQTKDPKKVFLTTDSIKGLRSRAKILQKISSGDIQTPEELAGYWYDKLILEVEMDV